ncbi:cysteine desulfurase [Ignavibacteria bacterium CHB1]|jgi:cysteine desulfurase IscS|nr:MAG: cysteine desulfurase [Chlorobiota bacterium]KXK05724.1 MAG: cysteine desulfurase [Chlorobi bacterium OLB4]MBV6398444.1 Cysteine desulfurase IscS [Ignavibacteria bacterium]MCC6885964.1 cysteine desulfurase [Ignavibacteriales bacterium]MCE7952786.1 cysteine desulfurase [Chlorobi bacterium CHB7]MDL1886896.1 cysteine desulfurase [Ignavibacteria bacterium CHB1]OQY77927.1 MAG: IscS subfamily cysteine desulfurase [Ignavibacteriales bacterium UTCHB1]RIK50416.1 MAG: IscS subfamily cysteine de
MLNFPLYFDYNATTPVDERVLEEMLPYFRIKFGNSSSMTHRFGWEAEYAVREGRARVASLIGASPEEIIFTAGATESVNLAIKGVAESNFNKGNHIITSRIEHSAVLDTVNYLSNRGFKITLLNVDRFGRIDIDELARSITPVTILVSIMAANNEIGTIENIREIADICKSRNVLFHSDATQAMGKVKLNVKQSGIDLMSFSAHKLYGPKGTGGLYLNKDRPGLELTKQIHGGGHESDLRSGTLNVPGIVGFGKACELCQNELETEAERLKSYRDSVINAIKNIEDSFINGDPVNRLPGNLSVGFDCVDSQLLISGMNEICFSTGSACSSGDMEISHVLKGIGLTKEQAMSTIRLGFGRFTTQAEVNYLIEKLVSTVQNIRSESPKWELRNSESKPN